MQFFENIKVITLFSLVFFAIFLFNYKKGNKLSNVMLASIYAFQGMEMLNGTFYRFSDFWINEFPWVFYSTEFTFFLWGPAIYFFFRFSVDSDKRFERKDLWHLVPAFIHTLFLCYVFHFNSNATKIMLLQEGVMTELQDFVIHFFKNGAVIIYLVFGTILYNKAKIENTKKKRWLMFFIVVFWIVECIQILHFVDLETRIYNTIIYNTTSIVWFLLSVITLYKALQDPFLFSFETKEEHKEKLENRRDRLSLDNEEYKDVLSAIEKRVIEEKAFLNPALNLKILSAELGFPSGRVSFVINDYYKSNISDFINSFRIEKAKELLSDEAYSSKTIIEVAYEVGFSSKATFNRAFSKFVEVSPTEFRKKD